MSALFDRSHWMPPERLSLSEWAQKHYFLSAESSAESGKFRPYPYQIGIMDAVTDPRVEQITWMKSARVGATKIINSIVGYYMHQDPCPIMVVQPTVDDAEGYSKEEIGPMLRDCPDLARIFGYARASKKTSDTIRHKIYPGGSISMVGANSGSGFRRVSRKIILFDEVDGYPASAGDDGDQILLGIRRSEHYWDRKIFAASTPLIAGASRIEQLYSEGDQRKYFVPCPHCGHFDELVFQRSNKGGHWMHWPKDSPEQAHYVCSKCEREIEHRRKRDLVENGEWRAGAEFVRHASFHIWAAYSYSPNAQWGQLATEFVRAVKAGPEKLRTYVNTVRGETWEEQGEAPDWERVYNRRERYDFGSVPDGDFLTCGVDVQNNRLVYEVVAWGGGIESWSVECGILWGGTASPDDTAFQQLDQLLARTFDGPGGAMPIRALAIDSGNFTQVVYQWCRRYPRTRVIPVKGQEKQKTLLSTPTKVEVRPSGRKVGSVMLWNVGVSIAKTELYGFLNQNRREDGTYPTGYCHFSEGHNEQFFQELTAEQLVTEVDRKGHSVRVWVVKAGRENHFLDCRNYARAAAAFCGVERLPARAGAAQPVVRLPATTPTSQQPVAAQAPPRQQSKRSGGGNWMSRGGAKRKRGGWL